MPELYIDEETENRKHTFCWLDSVGIPVEDRCSRCPNAAITDAAARPSQRRCTKFGTSLLSAFHAAADPESKIKDESKSLASSSKLPILPQAASSHETDSKPPIEDNLAQMSLAESLVKLTSTPDVSVTPTAPRVDVGEKRKAVVEPESQAKYPKKVVDLEYYFGGLTVQKRLKNEPQIPFQDADSGNGTVCQRYPQASWSTSTMQDRPTSDAAAFGSFVAGCNVNTAAEGRGVIPCVDDIDTPGRGVFAWPAEMDCEESED